jgi:hypothetical protein
MQGKIRGIRAAGRGGPAAFARDYAGDHRGRAPRNKGALYPPDPPTVDEIVAIMRSIGDGADGHRLRALIVLLSAPR